ncbi:MAG: nucleoside-diphosphate kinase [Candidatus Marinimicrobia bacterium]|jgi:nucleoside-diphosphate kinase|nr:nucleoside-diphosphate kinase [Candidatus Neomarinimicrobiota bacterium]MBT3947484.1 nucleoside-diphosphate kinase [Candidatus Neomarinimicrobiota bacterium]MBT4065258.1 nucleoside-diphosphate kinase [Candidatus Neomarinimicrobiota bacterium]MBT4308568.1 nucleoside-diphosphate kinase [Candidatus Neomarinimicrobiota bacterium]MBT4453999.1 nucleoside-diphosphate kinase [Candidatus Neomarinimicrobiota bacterium]|tara:strand:+ start:2030 stop:2455 length:426 start_codon:yes stop_codon:yes gene_type:complete
MNNRTFAMIKPDAVRNGHMGKILDRIIDAEFNILGAKLIRMTKAQAEGFYAVHSERPFFQELTAFMSSGKTMVIALEKNDAVSAWRDTIGATNPEEAAEGTIRKDFATSLGENAVHGADSDENATIEIGFFFTNSELISNQ